MPNPMYPLYEPFPDSLQTDPDTGDSLPYGQRYSDRVFDLPIVQRFLERLAPEGTEIAPGDARGHRTAVERKTAHQYHVFSQTPPYERLMGASMAYGWDTRHESFPRDRHNSIPPADTYVTVGGFVNWTQTLAVGVSWEMFAYPPPRTIVEWSRYYDSYGFVPPYPVPPELTDLPPLPNDGVGPFDPYSALDDITPSLVGLVVPFRGQVTQVSVASRGGLSWIPSRPTRGAAVLHVSVTSSYAPAPA